MIIEGKRKPQFEVRKKRGENKLYLILKMKSLSPYVMSTDWHIPQQYGGKLAITPPRWQDCYNVSWRNIPEGIQKAFLKCIQYIEKNGTPIENDEHVFPGYGA